MEKLLQAEKQFQVEGDYFAFLKKITCLLKVLFGEMGILLGGIGGLVVGGILALTGLFTIFAVCAFVNYGFNYFF